MRNETRDRASRHALWGFALLAVSVGGIAIANIALPGSGITSAETRSLAGESARVCVIDLERVFESAPQRTEMEATLQARDTQIREEINNKKKEIERLKGELGLNQPGSGEHTRIQRDLVQKQADLQFVSDQFEKEMEGKVLELRDALLGGIDKVVERVCDAEGFDIVIQKEFKIPRTKVVWNAVFYSRPSVDITDLVIAALPKE